MGRLPYLIASGLLYASAIWLTGPRQSLADTGRNLVRPLLLPLLWSGLDDAQRFGTPEEYASRGRVITGLIPEWPDGQIHVAGRLCFEASRAQPDPDRALDRLLAGLGLLEEAEARALDPAARREFLQSAARFLFLRCHDDAALAAAWKRRVGRSPTESVEAYVRRVPGVHESTHLRAELCFMLIGGLVTEIRLGESMDRILRHVDTALALLEDVEDRELARDWTHSLTNLRSYLLGNDDITLDELEKDERLRTVLEELRRR